MPPRSAGAGARPGAGAASGSKRKNVSTSPASGASATSAARKKAKTDGAGKGKGKGTARDDPPTADEAASIASITSDPVFAQGPTKELLKRYTPDKLLGLKINDRMSPASSDEENGLGRWTRRDEDQWRETLVRTQDEAKGQSFVIEDLLRFREHPRRKGAQQYRVKWCDYPIFASTWEPSTSFDIEIIEEFWARKGGRPSFVRLPKSDDEVVSGHESDTDWASFLNLTAGQQRTKLRKMREAWRRDKVDLRFIKRWEREEREARKGKAAQQGLTGVLSASSSSAPSSPDLKPTSPRAGPSRAAQGVDSRPAKTHAGAKGAGTPSSSIKIPPRAKPLGQAKKVAFNDGGAPASAKGKEREKKEVIVISDSDDDVAAPLASSSRPTARSLHAAATTPTGKATNAPRSPTTALAKPPTPSKRRRGAPPLPPEEDGSSDADVEDILGGFSTRKGQAVVDAADSDGDSLFDEDQPGGPSVLGQRRRLVLPRVSSAASAPGPSSAPTPNLTTATLASLPAPVTRTMARLRHSSGSSSPLTSLPSEFDTTSPAPASLDGEIPDAGTSTMPRRPGSSAKNIRLTMNVTAEEEGDAAQQDRRQTAFPPPQKAAERARDEARRLARFKAAATFMTQPVEKRRVERGGDHAHAERATAEDESGGAGKDGGVSSARAGSSRSNERGAGGGPTGSRPSRSYIGAHKKGPKIQRIGLVPDPIPRRLQRQNGATSPTKSGPSATLADLPTIPRKPVVVQASRPEPVVETAPDFDLGSLWDDDVPAPSAPGAPSGDVDVPALGASWSAAAHQSGTPSSYATASGGQDDDPAGMDWGKEYEDLPQSNPPPASAPPGAMAAVSVASLSRIQNEEEDRRMAMEQAASGWDDDFDAGPMDAPPYPMPQRQPQPITPTSARYPLFQPATSPPAPELQLHSEPTPPRSAVHAPPPLAADGPSTSSTGITAASASTSRIAEEDERKRRQMQQAAQGWDDDEPLHPPTPVIPQRMTVPQAATVPDPPRSGGSSIQRAPPPWTSRPRADSVQAPPMRNSEIVAARSMLDRMREEDELKAKRAADQASAWDDDGDDGAVAPPDRHGVGYKTPHRATDAGSLNGSDWNRRDESNATWTATGRAADGPDDGANGHWRVQLDQAWGRNASSDRFQRSARSSTTSWEGHDRRRSWKDEGPSRESWDGAHSRSSHINSAQRTGANTAPLAQSRWGRRRGADTRRTSDGYQHRDATANSPYRQLDYDCNSSESGERARAHDPPTTTAAAAPLQSLTPDRPPPPAYDTLPPPVPTTPLQMLSSPSAQVSPAYPPPSAASTAPPADPQPPSAPALLIVSSSAPPAPPQALTQSNGSNIELLELSDDEEGEVDDIDPAELAKYDLSDLVVQ